MVRTNSRIFAVVASGALAVALFAPAPGAAQALEPGNDDVEPPERREIKLRFATFDPILDGEPQVPGRLRASQDSDAYIVQFVGPPTDEMRARLTELGARVFLYLPDHAHIVRMTEDTRTVADMLPFVRWIGQYHPAYKLEEELVEKFRDPEGPDEPEIFSAESTPGAARYSIMTLARGEDQKAVAARVERMEGRVDATTEQGFRLEATLTDDQLLEVARMGEALFIDRWMPPEDDMDIVRMISGADFLETVAGYSGQGVRGEVMDSKLLTSHEAFQVTPPIIHAGNDLPTQNCGGDGHGTCAYGVVFGDGTGNAQARGLLPDAQGIFTARSYVADRYAHTAQLVDPAGALRAVFQTNSWGGGLTTQYTTVSAEMDDILFLNDIVITQSQSNAGSQMSRPQAWAKNIVSVGGIRHLNTLDISDDNWGFGASTGPAADGRIKPDLSHFYDSTLTPSSTGNTNYANFGGTSGATPITAGHFGLLFQMWADGIFSGGPGAGVDVFDARPHMTTAKVLMVNMATAWPLSGDIVRTNQGWGRADVQRLYELARQHDWNLPVLVDETQIIEQGNTHEYQIEVGADDCFLKATMAYADPMGNPASTQARINDLSLKLTAPDSTVYWGNNGLLGGTQSTSGGASNTVDTLENVFLDAAQIGTWTVAVVASEIVEDAYPPTDATDADYALVATKCAEVDAEAVLVHAVNPPAEILVGEDVPINVQAIFANNGPGGPSPAAFEVTVGATAPPDCAIIGADQATLPLTIDILQLGEVFVPFTIRCDQPSFHTFDFDASIVSTEPDVRDPDPSNNAVAGDMTVAVIKQVTKGLVGIGVDTDRLRAVISPVEPGEPMVGLGPLAAPWAAAGDRPLPWALTANPAPAVPECVDAVGNLPQPGHGNWANPRGPITLVVSQPEVPVSLFVDDLDCSTDPVNVVKTVTLTVTAGDCNFAGAASTQAVVDESEVAGWNLPSAPVGFLDALTMGEGPCTVQVEVAKEPKDLHYELLGATSGAVEVVLLPAKNGRMTGGGSVFDASGNRYDHGFQVRCDSEAPNVLQISWGSNQKFHLETLTGLLCFDDPGLLEGLPVAGFDSAVGNGLGRASGVSGTPVWFYFTDAGEPGAGVDLAEFSVDAAPVVSGLLDKGNQQAHPDTP